MDHISTFGSYFIGSFVALIIIMNPLSTASVFLTITKWDSKKKRILTAKRASIAAAIILLIFAISGNFILNFFGVTVDAFRIAGGLLITRIGLAMIKTKDERLHYIEEDEARKKEDISLIPLAIPMLSGPGAMTTAIVLMGETGGWASHNYFAIFGLLAAIVISCLISYIVLTKSLILKKYIKKNEQKVVDKIMGLIVLVIGIQFFINGVTNILLSLK